MIGALRNALTIADMGRDRHIVTPDQRDAAFEDIARLIRHAIEGLSEPNLPAVQAAATMIREYEGSCIAEGDFQRHARDVAAAILRAAVIGEIPKTWSEP